jgi:hypothetical protein
LWEIALNILLHVPFENVYDWKGTEEVAGKVNSTEINK